MTRFIPSEERYHMQYAGDTYMLQCYLLQLNKIESLISLTTLYETGMDNLVLYRKNLERLVAD